MEGQKTEAQEEEGGGGGGGRLQWEVLVVSLHVSTHLQQSVHKGDSVYLTVGRYPILHINSVKVCKLQCTFSRLQGSLTSSSFGFFQQLEYLRESKKMRKLVNNKYGY